MADLRHLLAIYVHARQAGNSVPPHIDADARAALAAEPAFAASEPSDEDLADLAEVFNGDPLPAMRRALDLWGRPAPDHRDALEVRPLLEQVARLGDCIGQHTVREITVISDRAAAWLRENPPGQPVAIEPRGCPTPGACSCVEPPAPAPAADGEREELADRLGWIAAQLSDIGWGDDSASVARAATLLRGAGARAPVPVPVAERPWERPGWCDTEGRCWWGRCADEVFNPEWALAPHADIKEFCSDAMPQHCLPHWAIPQPPQGGEVT